MEKISLTPVYRSHWINFKPDTKTQRCADDTQEQEYQKELMKKQAIHNIVGAYKYQYVKKPLDKKTLQSLNITNLRLIDNNSVRGETLSSKKNRWAIRKLKGCGIESVIDLRDKFPSSTYKQMCISQGLKYYNFPIDSHSTSDDTIIKNFPLMFKVMDDGRYYISCAQGLHRTDIALALNYVFNPRTKDVPRMSGHHQDNMNIDDILRRINSISKKIKQEDLKSLGWSKDAQEEIMKRKINLSKLYYKNED